MKFTLLNIICLLVVSATLTHVKAQSLVDDANTQVPVVTSDSVFNETIKIISNSKKIFILSNNNNQLTMGDFISLALNDKLAARALVAKVHQGQVGIKILKIYSLSQWNQLRRNLDVQIIKGDDTAFANKPPPKVDEETGGPRINSEEDLYNDTVTDNTTRGEVGDLEENANRHIKPDNIVGVDGSYLTGTLPDTLGGGNERTMEFGVSWAYQFRDNWFVEGMYGRALFQDFPNNGLSTLVNRLQARIKYNIEGPAYTYFMPYLGYQNVTVSSPDAGNNPAQGSVLNQEESDAIDEFKNKTGPTFGVTALRRLVPGWFVKANVGTDLLSLGFAVEF